MLLAGEETGALGVIVVPCAIRRRGSVVIRHGTAVGDVDFAVVVALGEDVGVHQLVHMGGMVRAVGVGGGGGGMQGEGGEGGGAVEG